MKNPDLQKFGQLLQSDPSVAEKLNQAFQKFEGDQNDQEAIFKEVVLPVAREYGCTSTWEEFQSYILDVVNGKPLDGEDLDAAELTQVAGGKGGGGITFSVCSGIGAGIGGGVSDKKGGGFCIVVGGGGGENNKILCLTYGWSKNDEVYIANPFTTE